MTKQKGFSKKILVSITGNKENHWRSKMEEIDKFKITEVGLFLERFKKKQREKIYKALLESSIKDIPLVHIRNDMAKEELAFLKKNFGSLYFTIHEDSFKVMNKWKGFYKHLFLEMNADNFVSKSVNVSRIGGFCVDLSHFKIEATKWSEEFEYIFKRRDVSRYFKCNHLNGYSPSKNMDMHTVKKIEDFDYLKTIPQFLFGDVVCLETDNSIAEQLEFQIYLYGMLDNLFKE